MEINKYCKGRTAVETGRTRNYWTGQRKDRQIDQTMTAEGQSINFPRKTFELQRGLVKIMWSVDTF